MTTFQNLNDKALDDILGETLDDILGENEQLPSEKTEHQTNSQIFGIQETQKIINESEAVRKRKDKISKQKISRNDFKTNLKNLKDIVAPNGGFLNKNKVLEYCLNRIKQDAKTIADLKYENGCHQTEINNLKNFYQLSNILSK